MKDVYWANLKGYDDNASLRLLIVHPLSLLEYSHGIPHTEIHLKSGVQAKAKLYTNDSAK